MHLAHRLRDVYLLPRNKELKEAAVVLPLQTRDSKTISSFQGPHHCSQRNGSIELSQTNYLQEHPLRELGFASRILQ